MIRGFQKTSLLDYPGQPCAVIFFSGCNFRCSFCHNPELVLDSKSLPAYQENEILKELIKRKNLVKAVTLSGGEPLMHDISKFMERLKQEGFLVKLDTNGCYPEQLKSLVLKGLVDYVAMDIKGKKEDYPRITCAKCDINNLERSILLSKGNIFEFRTTVVRGLHNKESLRAMAAWLNSILGEKIPLLALQQFNNKTELVNNEFREIIPYSPEEFHEFSRAIMPYAKRIELRGI